MDAHPATATICLAPGSYTLDRTLRPRSGQTIRGSDSDPPTIACAEACFDGQNGPDDVTLVALILEGASRDDVRTGDRWLIDHVVARSAAQDGVKVTGTGTVVRASTMEHNGRFGLAANGAIDVQVLDSTIADNPTDPSFGEGFSGGLKANDTVGMIVRGTTFRDTGGAGALWFDINSRDFQIVGNLVSPAGGDGIRIEISCNGTVESNVVSGAAGTQIDVFNSHDITVRDNDVDASSAGSFAIRMLGNGRESNRGGTAGRECADGARYRNADNLAESNRVSLGDGAMNGVVGASGDTLGNTFVDNDYRSPDCEASSWTWWTGTSQVSVGFTEWQAFAQDTAGGCG